MKTLLAITFTLLSGCASVYNWHPQFPPSDIVKWEVVNQVALHTTCGVPASEMPELKACAIQIRETKTCTIFSVLTEREAGTYADRDGRWLDQHERDHCRGFRHSDMRLSATTATRKD